MSSSDPEEPDDDPFAGMLHRVVIPEAADVAKIFGDDIDPSREPFADCGKLLPSGGSLDPGIWGGS
jgi:hypothetical protein